MEPIETDFNDIQWDRLLKRLTACAAKWFLQEGCSGKESVLPATGKSAKELAFDTVSEFIKGRIQWRPTCGESADFELFLLLRKVMRNDFLDLVKEGRAYKRTDVLDPSTDGNDAWGEYDKGPTLDNLRADSESGFSSLNAAVVARRVLPLLQEDHELVDYVNAVLVQGCLKREDIATCLQISHQEATNRQRRLRKKLASWKRGIERSNTTNQR
jgi:hypothetical protein